MITSDVKTTLCFTGFGNPSEETMLNWFVHTSLFLHAVDREEYVFRKRPVLRSLVHYVWPILGFTYLGTHMFALVALGANSFNQVLFGGTLGFTLAMIMHFWVKPYFIDLQSKLTKKQIAESEHGDEVYEDRYMLRPRHFVLILLLTCVLPITVSVFVLKSFGDEIDEDFKSEVILQKIWMGNECPINLNDASEILQYKHFICEFTIVGLTGVWLG